MRNCDFRGALWGLGCMTALFIAPAAQATTFNDVSDFSLNNPTGAWSYLAGGKVLGTTVNNCGGGSLECLTNGLGLPDSASVIKNMTGTTVTTAGNVKIAPDHLNLDPEGVSNVAVEWTAPTAGYYSIVGDFLGDDLHQVSHRVEITDNGVDIFSSVISAFGQLDAFSMELQLSAGDQIEFIVDTGSTYTDLSTGLAATISIPEPAPLALLGGTLLILGFVHRRTSSARLHGLLNG